MKVIPWSLFRLVCLDGVEDVPREFRLLAQIPDSARKRESAIHRALKTESLGHEYFRGPRTQAMVEAIAKLPLDVQTERYLENRSDCRACGASYPEHTRVCRYQGHYWKYLDEAGIVYPKTSAAQREVCLSEAAE